MKYRQRYAEFGKILPSDPRSRSLIPVFSPGNRRLLRLVLRRPVDGGRGLRARLYGWLGGVRNFAGRLIEREKAEDRAEDDSG